MTDSPSCLFELAKGSISAYTEYELIVKKPTELGFTSSEQSVPYSNQKPIDSGWVNNANLKKFASEIPGLDIREFSSCLDSEKYRTFIQNDIDLALSFGFKETPSFIIANSNSSNPEFLQGALPFPSFKVVIDKKLADLP